MPSKSVNVPKKSLSKMDTKSSKLAKNAVVRSGSSITKPKISAGKKEVKVQPTSKIFKTSKVGTGPLPGSPRLPSTGVPVSNLPSMSSGHYDRVDKFVRNDPYYQTLISPGTCMGVKAPVGGNPNTAAYTFVVRTIITASEIDTQFVAAAMIGLAGPGGAYSGTWMPLDNCPYGIGDTTMAGLVQSIGMLQAGVPTAVDKPFSQASNDNASPPILCPNSAYPWLWFDSARIVSAGFTLSSGMSPMNSEGFFTVVCSDPLSLADEAGGNWDNLTIGALQSMPNSMVVPISSTQSVHGEWRPIDLSTMNFKAARDTAISDSNLIGQWSGQVFCVVASGLPEAGVFELTIVVNIEGVPIEASPFAFMASPGVDDMISFSECQGMALRDRNLGIGLGSCWSPYNQVNADSHPYLKSHFVGLSKGCVPTPWPHPVLISNPKGKGDKDGKKAVGSFLSKISRVWKSEPVSMFRRLAAATLPKLLAEI